MTVVDVVLLPPWLGLRLSEGANSHLHAHPVSAPPVRRSATRREGGNGRWDRWTAVSGGDPLGWDDVDGRRCCCSGTFEGGVMMTVPGCPLGGVPVLRFKFWESERANLLIGHFPTTF